jgi:hypothetical protein
MESVSRAIKHHHLNPKSNRQQLALASQFLRKSMYPNTGKIICLIRPRSNVLEHITARGGLDERTAIWFAFYNYRTSDSQNPKQIAAAFLKQLCRHSATVPIELLNFKQDARLPSLADIEQFLIKLPAVMKLKEIFIIVDALDECHEKDRPTIIRLLAEIIKRIPCAKVFVTSRRESDIERAFAESKTPTIQIQAENVEADIRSFVESEIRKLRQGYYGKKLFLSNDLLENQIISSLTGKAEGMQVDSPTVHRLIVLTI